MGELVPKKDTERMPDPGALIQIGQWYWATEQGKSKSRLGSSLA
jgi:hypothetical protein